MTKGEMVELVYLYVSGGQLNADINIKREDISAMLAIAVNFIILKETRLRKREGMSELEGTESGVDSDFLGTFYLDVQYDEQRGLYYIEPTVRVTPLPFNRGIDMVAPLQGHVNYVRMKGQFEDVGIGHVLRNQTRYWFERVGTAQRIYLKNIPESVNTLMMKAVVSADDLGDDDEIPVPSGTEMEVLQVLQQWFSGEKQIPEDLRNDNSDGSIPFNVQKNPIKP